MLYEHTAGAYSTGETRARASLYGGGGIPFMCFDGMNPKKVGAYTNDTQQYNWYKSSLNARLAVASPFDIEAVYFVGGSSGQHAYTFAKVTNTSGDVMDNITLMFGSYEDMGSSMYHYICRRITSGGGYTFQPGETKYICLDLDCYNASNMDNVGVVVLAQDLALARKDVHQADWADRVEPATVTPDAYTIIRGVLVSGELGDLFGSDDSRLVVEAGIVMSSDEPPVWLTIDGTAPSATPMGLVFTLEAGANTSGLTQKIELYNYVTESFEEIDSRNATVSESVVEIMVTGDPSRFIDPNTLAVKAQLSWKPTGPIFVWPFQVGIDQAVWKVVE